MVAARKIACRRYGEPRLDIWLWVELNSPDCFTDGSMHAYATRAEEFLNRLISPISPSMVAAAMIPTPGIVCRKQSKVS